MAVLTSTAIFLCVVCLLLHIRSFDSLTKKQIVNKNQNKKFFFSRSYSNNKIPPISSRSVSGNNVIIGGGGGGFRGGGGTSLNAGGGDNGNNSDNNSAINSFNLFTLIKRIVEMYNNALVESPLITKILSSAFVSGLGDILIQFLTAKKDGSPIDLRRVIVFASCGGLYIAPVIGFWFNWLNSWPLPQGTAKTLLMLVADQTVGTFAVLSGFYFAFEAIQRAIPPFTSHEMGILDAGMDSWRKNLWKTMKANYYCWPLINYINFSFIPLNYRVLFSNFAAVFWNMYLSSVANS